MGARATTLAVVLCGLRAVAQVDGGSPLETTVRAPVPPASEERGASAVQRADLERRLPRSSPDALRFEPGVFVQQTAHGQGSAFVRGLTGQQTVVLFDGIRLNNSTWRQGPNQYLFTVDAKSLGSIEVLRGGAATRFGSDALGGVIHAHPLEPAVGRPGARASVQSRGATADSETGGRAQLEVSTARWGVTAGAGGRSLGLLEGSGPLLNPADGAATAVPRLAPDGRHQLGTGFKELTADARFVTLAGERQRFTFAGYLYRQLDAPRTDQCPPARGRADECLTYQHQFRSLVYGAWDAGGLGRAAETARVTVSWQQQHEFRSRVRPPALAVELGEDDVDTLGVTASATTAPLTLLPGTWSRFTWGVDAYLDLVRSRAWLGLLERSRGQYLGGSRASTGGGFVAGELRVSDFVVRSGGRLGWAALTAPADAASGTGALSRAWVPVAGQLGVRWAPLEAFALVANLDHSFRTPNLDDLTARQQTGVGFQFESPGLLPEQATTLEAGVQLTVPRLTAEVWAFRTLLANAISRVPRDVAACPPSAPQCASSAFRYQLVNAGAPSTLSGLEGSVRVRPLRTLTVQANAAWTWGDGPNPTDALGPPVPLSRIPPLNGTLEVSWLHPAGVGLGAALRWAGPQSRLAVSDSSDPRIPLGGTPGFAVVDLRASWRVRPMLNVALVVENLLDTPYRYHGSSVNGPARGVLATVELSPSSGW